MSAMFIETFRLALLTVARNKLRSFLTVLGIVIGVASVIAMVTVGQGSTAAVQSDVASLGSNLLMIRPGQPGRGPGGGQNDAAPLALADVDALLTDIPDLVAATPSAGKTLNAVYGDTTHAVTVTGTDNAYFPVRGWTLSQGRTFTDQELRAGTPGLRDRHHDLYRVDRAGQSGGHHDPVGKDHLRGRGLAGQT